MTTKLNSPIGLAIDEKYEILGLIADGGFGSVYLAKQVDLDRRVAVKMLHQFAVLDEVTRLRFTREAQTLAGFRHRNIVSCYANGIWQNRTPYLVFELVRGQSLREKISAAAAKKLSWTEVVKMSIEILDALQAVHCAGVVHRDLKPENIMVLPDGSVKLLDFGVAHVSGQRLTQTGAVIGSLYYMSPEQGYSQEVSPASDLYSLGCIIFEALTGRHPHQCDSPVGLLHIRATQKAPLLSSVEKNLPADLDIVLAKALEINPQARYADAAQMSADLQQILAGLLLESKAKPADPPDSQPKHSIASEKKRRKVTLLKRPRTAFAILSVIVMFSICFLVIKPVASICAVLQFVHPDVQSLYLVDSALVLQKFGREKDAMIVLELALECMPRDHASVITIVKQAEPVLRRGTSDSTIVSAYLKAGLNAARKWSDHCRFSQEDDQFIFPLYNWARIYRTHNPNWPDAKQLVEFEQIWNEPLFRNHPEEWMAMRVDQLQNAAHHPNDAQRQLDGLWFVTDTVERYEQLQRPDLRLLFLKRASDLFASIEQSPQPAKNVSANSNNIINRKGICFEYVTKLLDGGGNGSIAQALVDCEKDDPVLDFSSIEGRLIDIADFKDIAQVWALRHANVDDVPGDQLESLRKAAYELSHAKYNRSAETAWSAITKLPLRKSIWPRLTGLCRTALASSVQAERGANARRTFLIDQILARSELRGESDDQRSAFLEAAIWDAQYSKNYRKCLELAKECRRALPKCRLVGPELMERYWFVAWNFDRTSHYVDESAVISEGLERANAAKIQPAQMPLFLAMVAGDQVRDGKPEGWKTYELSLQFARDEKQRDCIKESRQRAINELRKKQSL